MDTKGSTTSRGQESQQEGRYGRRVLCYKGWVAHIPKE